MDVEPSVHLAIGIEKLLTSGLYSDITFKSGDGDSTPAHRCILASFSPVFSTMLSSGLQEQATATITIADMTTAELRAFLAFLYTGHLERHEVADFGPAVLAACHKYCLPPPLKDACVTGLCRSVTPENCLALLELAELYGEKTLASKCRSVGSRLINVWFRRYNTQKSRLLSIVVPAAGTVAEIVSEVNKQLNRSSRIKASLRILQVSDHRIGRIFNKRDPISIISQAESNNESLRAEEVPPDEEKCVPGKYVLHVHHFRNGTWSYEAFGEPFAMNVHHLETLRRIKQRIKARLGVSNETLEKWKFAKFRIIPGLGRYVSPVYLEDSMPMSVLLTAEGGSFRAASTLALGIHHTTRQ